MSGEAKLLLSHEECSHLACFLSLRDGRILIEDEKDLECPITRAIAKVMVFGGRDKEVPERLRDLVIQDEDRIPGMTPEQEEEFWKQMEPHIPF